MPHPIGASWWEAVITRVLTHAGRESTLLTAMNTVVGGGVGETPHRVRGPLAVLEFEADGRITHCSDRAVGVVGCEANAATGHILWDLLPPGAATSPLGRVIHEVARTRTVTVTTVESFLRPGSLVWARITPLSAGGIRVALRYLKAKATGT